MLLTLLFGFFKPKPPEWLSAPIKWATDIAIVLLLLFGVYSWIEHKGEKKGAANVEAKAVQAHVKTVEEARADTNKAQTTVNAIGKQVTADNNKATTLVTDKTTEIHNAIAKSPSVPNDVPTPLPVFDGSGVRDSVNALVERANGSADTADTKR